MYISGDFRPQIDRERQLLFSVDRIMPFVINEITVALPKHIFLVIGLSFALVRKVPTSLQCISLCGSVQLSISRNSWPQSDLSKRDKEDVENSRTIKYTTASIITTTSVVSMRTSFHNSRNTDEDLSSITTQHSFYKCKTFVQSMF